MSDLRARPISLREANAYVLATHRHHKQSKGHRFSIACFNGDRMCGVVIAGRPVGRAYDHRTVLEIARCATDGTPNAISFLYGAVCRAAKAIGYERVQTYTLPVEGGASMRAAGFKCVATTEGDTWTGRAGRDGRRGDQPQGPKWRWERVL